MPNFIVEYLTKKWARLLPDQTKKGITEAAVIPSKEEDSTKSMESFEDILETATSVTDDSPMGEEAASSLSKTEVKMLKDKVKQYEEFMDRLVKFLLMF